MHHLCEEIAADLDFMRGNARASLQSKEKWQDRIDRREESWERMRPMIFEDIISKEGYPQANVSINALL